MQTEQNRKEYQEIGVLEAFEATETFEYKNARSDFAVITEKNKKYYVILQLNFRCISQFLLL